MGISWLYEGVWLSILGLLLLGWGQNWGRTTTRSRLCYREVTPFRRYILQVQSRTLGLRCRRNCFESMGLYALHIFAHVPLEVTARCLRNICIYFSYPQYWPFCFATCSFIYELTIFRCSNCKFLSKCIWFLERQPCKNINESLS